MSARALAARNMAAWKMLKAGLPLSLRRRSRRRMRRILPKIGIPRTFRGPVPTSMVCKMRYCAYKDLSPAAGGQAAVANFRANGIYDPDCAVGGGQPLGRDEIADFYNHYVVLSSKITVTFASKNESAQSYLGNVVGIVPCDDETITVTNWCNMAEQPFSTYKMLVGNVDAGNLMRPLTCRYNVKRFHAVNKSAVTADSALGSIVGADPTEQTIYLVFCGSLDQSTDTLGCWCMISIIYTVKFFEPKNLERS